MTKTLPVAQLIDLLMAAQPQHRHALLTQLLNSGLLESACSANLANRITLVWRECFGNPDAPRPVADASADWARRAGEHLPVTLLLLACRAAEWERVQTDSGQVPLLRYRLPARTSEEKGDRTLMLVTGFSDEQLALGIAVHYWLGWCRNVVPFTTVESWSAVWERGRLQELLGWLGITVGDAPDAVALLDPVYVSASDPADVFRHAVEWMRTSGKERPLAVDSTGGKKPMDAGAVHAASFYGLPAYYLDFTEYDHDFRRPRPWTCRYERLRLADDALSLSERGAALSAYKTGRFAVAAAALHRIADHASASGLLDVEDLRDLQTARTLVKRDTAWLDLRYDDPAFEPEPTRGLHTFFRQSLGKGSANEIDKLIESLQERDNFAVLFDYLVDEYWRLSFRVQMGSHREALVGAVAIIELCIDALFQQAWFDDVTVKSAEAQYWDGDDPPSAPVPEELAHLEGQRLPVQFVPRSAFGPKVKILRGRKRRGVEDVRLECWARPKTESDGTWSASFEGERLSLSEARLVVDVTLAVSSAPLAPIDSVWKKGFGNFPNADWVQLRHKVAHVPVPLVDYSLAEDALKCVPQFVELLRRVRGRESLGDHTGSDWVTWKTEAQYRREFWHERAEDLEGWLRLKV